MKTALSFLITGFALLGLSNQSIAADLVNQDPVEYTVLVNEAYEVWVPSQADVPVTCKPCTIQIEDSLEPPIQVFDNSIVIISGGKFIVEN
jgi:hypothetical protein